MTKLFSIELSLEELKQLDGKVSPEAQKAIDRAIDETSHGFDLPLLNEIIEKSIKTGTLKWRNKQIRSCNYCDKKYDYHTYPRSGRYHSKGDKNYDKPKYYYGIKFNEGLVTFEGDGDMCSDCCTKQNILEQIIDHVIEKDLPIEIMKNDYKVSKYLKDNIKICYSCNTEMQESKMKQRQTLMGDGTYSSGCPHCKAESLPFGQNHRSTDKFVMIPNPAARDEVQELRNFVKEYNLEVGSKENGVNLGQSKRNMNVFIVQENKFTNGYRDVISLNVEKGLYEIGYFYKDKIKTLTDKLEKYGLVEAKFGDKRTIS